MSDSVGGAIRAGAWFASGATLSILVPGAPVWTPWVGLALGAMVIVALEHLAGREDS